MNVKARFLKNIYSWLNRFLQYRGSKLKNFACLLGKNSWSDTLSFSCAATVTVRKASNGQKNRKLQVLQVQKKQLVSWYTVHEHFVVREPADGEQWSFPSARHWWGGTECCVQCWVPQRETIIRRRGSTTGPWRFEGDGAPLLWGDGESSGCWAWRRLRRISSLSINTWREVQRGFSLIKTSQVTVQRTQWTHRLCIIAVQQTCSFSTVHCTLKTWCDWFPHS